MKSFLEFYTEAKQVGILYHYTALFRLPRIIAENKLGFESAKYVSFTRDKHFHKHYREGIEVEECRFVIDGDKLSENYRILPYNYFGDKSQTGIGPYASSRPHQKTYDEQEERISKQVTNLKNYVIKIQIFKKMLDRIFSTDIDRKFYLDNIDTKFILFNSAEKFLEYIRQFYRVEVI